MNSLEQALLEKVSDLHTVPSGAYNIRKNGQLFGRNSTSDIEIRQKSGKPGIDIIVKKGVKNKSIHIPVIITVGGIHDLVHNDFYIGDDSDVFIVAGCGIHNKTCNDSRHDGVHTFHIGKNAKVKYVERHIGEGDGSGGKVLNPVTKIYMKENSVMEIETIQLGGVTSTVRKTVATLGDGATLRINENLLTELDQTAKTHFKVMLNGENSSVDVISHSVAKGSSHQEFVSNIIGKNACFGHVECDGILLDKARIISTPMIDAADNRASLVHEAAIGKIAGDELVKLMTLGLSEHEAEDMIIQGFLLG